MAQKRKAYAPFSLTSEAGVGQTPVEGYVDVNQMIYPSVDTGVIDENGEWKGVKSSDKEFIAFTKDETVPNGGEILTPTANPDGSWPLDMTGFKNIFVAIKTTRAGNYQLKAVMGPDSVSFANLSPIVASAPLRGLAMNRSTDRLDSLFFDPSDTLVADAWNIIWIETVLQDQKVLQFLITNDSGGEASSIECAFLRTV